VVLEHIFVLYHIVKKWANNTLILLLSLVRIIFMKPIEPSIKRRLRIIKGVVLDVDGVLTDGGMYYGVGGEIMKKFNARDGMGIELMKQNGIRVAIISGENIDIIRRRAEKLGLEDVYIGITDKLSSVKDFATRYNLKLDDIAYIGDDINDLQPLEAVGFAVAVADAQEEVKLVADLVLEKKGGDGAVREFADYVLRSR
jgi:YrbI family 3-deoxy-D-manno-octulosonate 8-phosphate phosphatase